MKDCEPRRLGVVKQVDQRHDWTLGQVLGIFDNTQITVDEKTYQNLAG